jgi:hypothetical protein
MAGGGGGGGGGAVVTCTFNGGAGTSAWETAGNWNCGHIPTSSDTVIIPDGQSVEFSTGSVTTGGITVNTLGTLTITGGALTAIGAGLIHGTWIMNGGTFSSPGDLIYAGGTLRILDGTFTSSGAVTNNGTIESSGLSLGTGVLSTNSLANAGVITHTNGYAIQIGSGGLSDSSGTYTSAALDSSVIRFTGTANIPSTYLYPNVQLAGTVTLSGNTISSVGNVSILSGANLVSNSSTIQLTGNWVQSSDSSVSLYGSTIRFTGTATSTLTAPAVSSTFFTIQIAKDSPDVGLSLGSDAAATRALLVTQGLFDANGHTLTLPHLCQYTNGGGDGSWTTATNWDCESVARVPNEVDQVTVSGGAAVTLASATEAVGALSIDGTSSLTVGSGGVLNIHATSSNAGSIAIAGGSLKYIGGSQTTQQNSGSIVGTASGLLFLDSVMTNTGRINMTAGGILELRQPMATPGAIYLEGLGVLRITPDAVSGFAIPASVTSTAQLLIAPTVSPPTVHLDHDLIVQDALTLDGSSFSLNGCTLTLAGGADLTSLSSGANRGFSAYDPGVLLFSGAGDQSITASWSSIGTPFEIPEVRINKTSGSVYQAAGTVNVTNGFRVQEGTYNIDGNQFVSAASSTIDAAGVVTSTIAATIAFGQYASGPTINNGIIDARGATTIWPMTNNGVLMLGRTADFYQDFTNNGTIDATGTDMTLIGGTFTNNGTFLNDGTTGSFNLISAGDTFLGSAGSVFGAPATTTFGGPTTMPAYSYHDVNITVSTAMTTSTANLTMGTVAVSSPATFSITNTAATQSAVRATMNRLTIASGAEVDLTGVTAGPTVTTTVALANSGTLAVTNGLLGIGGTLTNTGTFTNNNGDLWLASASPITIPFAIYDRLTLTGAGVGSLSASTTVLTTSTVSSLSTLDLGAYRLNAVGDIANSGTITSSTGGVLHHPVDYVRFTDVTGGTTVPSYANGDDLYVSVKDQSRNLDGTTQETITIPVTADSAAGSDAETVTLTETTASSGIFRNSSAIPVRGRASVTAQNAYLDVSASGVLTASYTDPNDPAGMDGGGNAFLADTSSTTATVSYTAPAPAGGGGGGGGGGVGGSGSFLPASGYLLPVVVLTPPAQTVSTQAISGEMPQAAPAAAPQAPLPAADPATDRRVAEDLARSHVPGSVEERALLASFVEHGSSPASVRLGAGEREALLRDALETMRRASIPLADLDAMAEGRIPQTRSLTQERALAPRALAAFRQVYGHAPNFRNTEENLFWNTLMYRIRFPRDLALESQGIREFRAQFHRSPSDPFQWAVVRGLGYVQR